MKFFAFTIFSQKTNFNFTINNGYEGIQLNSEEFEDDEEERESKEFEERLRTLSFSELMEVYYTQACEISRIRQIILDSVKDDEVSSEEEKKEELRDSS